MKFSWMTRKESALSNRLAELTEQYKKLESKLATPAPIHKFKIYRPSGNVIVSGTEAHMWGGDVVVGDTNRTVTTGQFKDATGWTVLDK
jgi:hypothetical protein